MDMSAIINKPDVTGEPLRPPENQTTDKKDKTDKKAKKPKKSRAMMYVQQLEYLPHIFKETTTSAIQAGMDTIYNYVVKHFPDAEIALILHDKDVYTASESASPGHPGVLGAPKDLHIHIAFYFPNARSVSSVAKTLGQPVQTVEMFNGRNSKQALFAYLIHRTANAQAEGKYQYDFSEVRANFDYKGFVERSSATAKARGLDIDDVVAKIIKGDMILKDFFIDGPLGTKEEAGIFFTQHEQKIEKAVKTRYRLQMHKKGDVDLEIIYIQGEAGSGKTTLAKEYAEKKYGDYFLTGSSNDTVQDYMGEPVAIFDDARPSDFDASNWLKLLDPYNNKSSVTSRYYNKYLAVKCIILTTTTDFEKFFLYAKNKGGVDEPIDQFMRRFNIVIKAWSKSDVDEIGNSYTYGRVFEVIKSEPYTKMGVTDKDGRPVHLKYDLKEVPGSVIKKKLPERRNDEKAKDFLSFFETETVDPSEVPSEPEDEKKLNVVQKALEEKSRREFEKIQEQNEIYDKYKSDEKVQEHDAYLRENHPDVWAGKNFA